MSVFLQAEGSTRYYCHGEVEGIEYKNAEFLQDFGIFKKGEQHERIIISLTTGEIVIYNEKGKITQPFALVPREKVNADQESQQESNSESTNDCISSKG
jgi:hypothetical protein